MKKFEDQLFDDVYVRRQKAKDFKPARHARAYRIAKKCPEAVFRITSWAHGKESVGNTLSYVSREGDLAMEDPQGALLDAKDIEERLDEWALDFDTWKKRSRESAHITFSSPKGSDPEAVSAAVRKFAWHVFANHDYLMVRHDDTDNPHVHVVVKARGFDLTKLDPGMKDIKDWRRFYAECLRDEGVQVEASSRLMRGLLGPAKRFKGTKPYLPDPQRDVGPIPPVELSTSQKRYIKLSQGYQRAFEAIADEMVKKGAEKGDKRLLGMGEAIQDYAKKRDSQQRADIQRLYFAKRQLDKPIKAKDGPELDC